MSWNVHTYFQDVSKFIPVMMCTETFVKALTYPTIKDVNTFMLQVKNLIAYWRVYICLRSDELQTLQCYINEIFTPWVERVHRMITPTVRFSCCFVSSNSVTGIKGSHKIYQHVYTGWGIFGKHQGIYQVNSIHNYIIIYAPNHPCKSSMNEPF